MQLGWVIGHKMLCNCQMPVHTLHKPGPSLHVLGVHGSGVPTRITCCSSGTHPSGCRLARQLQAQVVCKMVAVELQ